MNIELIMKTNFLFLFCCLNVSLAFSQIENPVHWNFTANKINDKQYEIHLRATMDHSWHLYAQAQPKDAIAQPTLIKFSKNPLLIISGKPKEKGRKEKYENKEVGISAWQYAGSIDFVQTIAVKSFDKFSAKSGTGSTKINISGTITYQTCTEERCLPPKTINFSIPLN